MDVMPDLEQVIEFVRTYKQYVFPCVPNAKRPAIADWEARATQDEAQIRAWAQEIPGCNWGWALGRTGLTALDIDRKSGVNGDETLRAWEDESWFLPKTYTQETPSGGEHRVMLQETKNSTSKLGPGLDTRSAGGLILVPGSVIDGKFYRTTDPSPFAKMPNWLFLKIGLEDRRRDPEADKPLTDWDLPANVARFREILEEHPEVEPGARNQKTYELACVGRDLAISEELSLDLMTELWLPKLVNEDEDPSGFHETHASCYRTAKRPPGNKSAEVLAARFEELMDPEILDDEPRIIRPEWVISAASIRTEDIPRRQWTLGRRYLRGHFTLTIAPGGVGKSTLTILEALAIWSGKDLTGDTVYRRGPVWIYTTEDSRNEILRRIHATAKLHGIDDISGIHVSSGIDNPFWLVAETTQGLEKNVREIKRIIAKGRELGIVHMIIDPFVRAHRVNENNNMAIDLVCQCVQHITIRVAISMSVVHHANKAGAGAAGSAAAARGATSLVAASRIAHTLVNANEAECKTLGIPKQKAPYYVRLDDAKANLSPPGASTRWFERISVPLGQGDAVGVLRLKPTARREVMLVAEDQNLVEEVFRRFRGTTTCAEMAAAMIGDGASEYTQKTLVKKLTELFASPQVRDGMWLGKCLVTKRGVDRDGIKQLEIDEIPVEIPEDEDF